MEQICFPIFQHRFITCVQCSLHCQELSNQLYHTEEAADRLFTYLKEKIFVHSNGLYRTVVPQVQARCGYISSQCNLNLQTCYSISICAEAVSDIAQLTHPFVTEMYEKRRLGCMCQQSSISYKTMTVQVTGYTILVNLPSASVMVSVPFGICMYEVS